MKALATSTRFAGASRRRQPVRGTQKGRNWSLARIALLFGLLAGAGCCAPLHCEVPAMEIPRELDMVSLSAYVLEPPDIILVDAVQLVPKPPYRIESLDELSIHVANPLAEPVSGIYLVDPDGTVNLGVTYGTVRVAGLTIEEAKKAVAEQLKKTIKDPVVQMSLARGRALQQIRGEHLIRPDGTIGLGNYGSVYVSGLTVDEAKQAIEAHLSQFVLDPQVSVDVFAYNSKVYYLITDGGGYGEQVYRFTATGKETVLDALSNINGLPPVSSRKRIWLTRPAPAGEHEQIMPIDWYGITRRGKTATNYQVLPGDRIYVQAEPLVTVDTFLSRVISPIERLMGVTLLGNAVVEGLQPGQAGGGSGF
jgi:polysaccharide export outer membrane protein